VPHRNTALATVVILAVLNGCAGAGSALPGAGSPAGAVTATRSQMGQTQKVPRVLAYVGNGGTNSIDVYSYPSFTPFEQLPTAGSLGCADPAGNVWFIESNSTLVEYAHGGTTPIATLQDPGNYATSCAVSSSSDTLAVANIFTTQDGPGNIALYAHEKGKPRIIQAAQHTYFLTYDDRDNLFGDGESSSYQFELFELAKGATMIEPLTVGGATIQFPGSVQYAGSTLNVVDQEAAANYELRVKGDAATVVGTTPLSDSSDPVQCAIYGKRITCADAGNAQLAMYKYPAGGQPIKTVTGLYEPTGIVLSVNSK
jgi:hypothetical protein